MDKISRDLRLKAAAHNLLLEITAECFEVWDAAFCASIELEGKGKALTVPRHKKADLDWCADNKHLFNRLMIAIKMCLSAVVVTISFKKD